MVDDGAPEPTRNPYVGPRPFVRDDSQLFFGRDAEAAELLSLVIADRIVVLYAPSGAGKSSLLDAGLVPLLTRDRQFEVFPSARLGGGLDEHGQPNAGNVYMAGVLTGWADRSGAPDAERSLGALLAGCPHPVDAAGLPAPRVLIFDQFEELFTLYPAYWSQRTGCLRQIGQALEADPLLRVVMAIREDYLAELDAHASLLPGELRSRYRLERLGAQQALAAVTGPALETTRRYRPGVAEKLVANLMALRVDSGRGGVIEVEGEFVEPVQLQVICHNLWAGLPPDVTEITADHLRVYGDVDEVLRSFYDTAIRETAEAASVREARLREWIEKALITSGGTRSTVYRAADSTAGIPNKAVDELEDRHLIRPEWRAGARWYELTHDRLIEPIRVSNVRAERARAKRQRRVMLAIVAVGLFAAVVAGAVLSLGSGSDSASQQVVVRRGVQISGTRISPNVAYGSYLALVGGSVRGLPPGLLQTVGNVVLVNVAASGFRGTGLVIVPQMRSLATSRPLRIEPPPSVAGLTPSTNVSAAVKPVWIALPRVRGRFLYTVQVVIGSVVLASARTRSFTVTVSGNGAPRASVDSVRRRPAAPQTLHVRVLGPGNVLSSPAGVTCGAVCTAQFARGTSVVLTAVAAPGGIFGGWAGSPCSARGRCVLTMRGDTAVTAIFSGSPSPPTSP